MVSASGILFDIKRFAVHDGPGLRTTVFMKGCPLRCAWCQNPEGLDPAPQFAMEPDRCLEECAACIEVCPDQNLFRDPAGRGVNRQAEDCSRCGTCADACPAEAIRVLGRAFTVDEVMAELEKEQPFHEESGGGVTFSGGEPLAQPEFLGALLARCREAGIHSAVDTSGFAPADVIRSVAQEADLFLYDLKAWDEDRHRRFTGRSNRVILENLRLLHGLAREVRVRIPLVPGMNDGDDEIDSICGFLQRLDPVPEVSLLPYHAFYLHKREKLHADGRAPNLVPPAAEQVEAVKKKYESHGLKISVRH